MGRAWPLTGRSEELRLIAGALSGAGGHMGVVIAGPAGVGKTRLAREALAAENSRRLTRWVTATGSAQGLPLGAFAGVWKGTVEDPLGVVRAVMDALLEGAGRSGAVICIDDAHLLDQHSAFLVHQLIMQKKATVILTVRNGEAAPNSITELWKDGHLARLELQSLAAQETSALVAAVLGGPVEDSAAQRIWSITNGNALYLRLILDSEVGAHRWRPIGGVWQWIGETTIPVGLAELISAQMGDLSEPTASAVDLLSIAEPLEVTLLDLLTAPSATEIAESAGLVTVTERGDLLEARLAHPLYGEVRRARIGRLRGRRLRGLIAHGLKDQGDGRHNERPEDTLRRAVLTFDSDLPRDAVTFIDGARAAFALLDLPLASKLLEAAVFAGAGLDAKVQHAYALSLVSRGSEAEAILSQLADTADLDRTDTATIARIAGMRAGNLFWDLRQPAEAEAVLNRAEQAVNGSEARDVLTAFRSAFHSFSGRSIEGISAATKVLEPQRLPAGPAMMATWGLVGGLASQGRVDEVRNAAARGYVLAEQSIEAGFLRFGLCALHLHALQLAGYLEEARQVATNIRHATAEMPGVPQLFIATITGLIALGQGDLPEATRLLRQANAGFTTVDELGGWRFQALLGLTQALGMAGEGDAATRTLTELGTCRTPALRFLEPEALLAKAWAAAAQGVVSQAVDMANEGAALAKQTDQPAFEVLALQTAVRLGARTAGARLVELSRHVEGPRASLAAAYAIALGANDGNALDIVSNRFERIGDLLTAADSAAHAATAHSSRGLAGSALSAAGRAERLAQACGGSRTPAFLAATRPSPLTSREREIAVLAAQGLSNRVIAERLFVSVRTVEGHLYRAAAKLGGAKRSDLGDYL